MELKPFFSYFGGKWRAAKRYPKPLHSKIIEPFAGAAGYSIRYHQLDVTLYDLDPVICGMWDYLIKVTPEEVRRLPEIVNHVDDHNIPQEAKWLIGFWLNKATTTPHLTPSAWMRQNRNPTGWWGAAIRERIARQVECIKHWVVKQQSYEHGENDTATWFVDPPYSGPCGRAYRHKLIDYNSLAAWCLSRAGQVIVCEKEGADWLPFLPFATIKATPGAKGKSYSAEAIWTNHSSSSTG